MKNPIPFGKFLLLDRINVGGMAEVFYAKVFAEDGTDRLVAVKKILPTMVEDEEFISMFIDEARIAVQLDHPNIVQIYELGKHEENYYIAMEYVPGRDLRATLDRAKKRKEQIAFDVAVYLAAELAHGLDYAHRAKDHEGKDLHIVHRDVSPQNILISYDGQIKLIDFGIAKAATRNQKTQAGILKGKFGYMSPEQVRGLPIDRRSDIFALGVILYEMLTGERLFVGESDFSVLERVRNAEVVPPRQLNKDIPEELDRIVVHALEREADSRYQWASEIAADLLRFLGHEQPGQGASILGGYIRTAFSEEVLRERERMVRFAGVDRPAEVPPTSLRSFQGTRAPVSVPFVDEHTALVIGNASSDDWENPPDTNPMPNPGEGIYAPMTGTDGGRLATDTAVTPIDIQAIEPGTQASNAGKPPPPQTGELPVEGQTKVVGQPLRSSSKPGPPPVAAPPPPGPSLTAKVGIALIALLSVVFAVLYLRHQALPKGMLVITPHPAAGVTIEVDGLEVPTDADGVYVLRGVSIGEHLILAHGPHGTRALKIDVDDGKFTPVDIVLPTGEPEKVAPGPMVVVDAGAEAIIDAGPSVSATGVVGTGDAGAPSVAPPHEAVAVTIDSDPPEAAITVDEAAVGHAPYVLQAERGKQYTIRAELPGYRPRRQRERFSEAQTFKLTLSSREHHGPAAAPDTRDNSDSSASTSHGNHSGSSGGSGGGGGGGGTGKLIISSTQTAQVFVDGKGTGRYTPITPGEPLQVPTGRHLIKLQSDDGKKAERVMNISGSDMNRWLHAEML